MNDRAVSIDFEVFLTQARSIKRTNAALIATKVRMSA